MKIRLSLGVMALPVLISGASCGGSGGSASKGDEQDVFGIGVPAIKAGTAPASWDDPVVRPASETAAAALRRACTFKRGALPRATLGKEIPVGNGTAVHPDDGTVNDTAIPIHRDEEHIGNWTIEND